MRNLLGGKGAGLAEMANLGLPVPPGFTITTEVCTHYYANGKSLSDGPRASRSQPALAHIARITGKTLRRSRATRCWSRCARARAPRCPA